MRLVCMPPRFFGSGAGPMNGTGSAEVEKVGCIPVAKIGYAGKPSRGCKLCAGRIVATSFAASTGDEDCAGSLDPHNVRIKNRGMTFRMSADRLAVVFGAGRQTSGGAIECVFV